MLHHVLLACCARCAAQEELDEFYDAKSLLGSLSHSSAASLFLSAHEALPPGGASALSSYHSQYHSQYQPQYPSQYQSQQGLGFVYGAGSPRGAGGPGPSFDSSLDASLYQAHDLAASVRQVGALHAASSALPACPPACRACQGRHRSV